MFSATEAAFEAWSESGPEGFLLAETRARVLLCTLGAHLPGSEAGLPQRAVSLEALFLPEETCRARGLPEFGLLLGSSSSSRSSGFVHFLGFWRAFGTLAGYLGVASSSQGDSVVLQLSMVRDRLLTLLGTAACVAVACVAEALEAHVAACAAEPGFELRDFWLSAAAALQGGVASSHLGPDELAVLLLSWLHDATMWQHKPAANLRTGLLPARTNMRTGMLPMDDSVAELTLLQEAAGMEVGSPSSAGRSMMASAALVLDLQEHCRASGLDARSNVRSSPSRSPARSSRMASSVCSPSAQVSALGDTTLFPAGTLAGSENDAPLDATILPPLGEAQAPEGSPPALDVQNLRTAMMPLLQSPEVSCIEAPDGGAVEPPGAPPDLHVENLRTAMRPLDRTPDATLTEPELFIGLDVNLHIYDVSREASIQRLNAFLANRMCPLKLGGVFHAGVEVDGAEWSFGRTDDPQASGVTRVDPKCDPEHHFRETVPLQQTSLSSPQVQALLGQLRLEYPGGEYDLLRRNCCHFADDFCQRLGVGRIPGWVYRLARIGARIDAVQRPLSALRPQSAGRYRNLP